MAEHDRLHWDEKYSGEGLAPHGAPGPPTVLAAYEHLFPTSGHAIDLAVSAPQRNLHRIQIRMCEIP